MLAAIDRIEEYSSQGREELERNELVRVWMLHHLLLLGEAAGGVSAALRVSHSEIPWREAHGMRNVVVHECFGIDLDAVWATIESDLPALKEALIPVLEELEG